MAAVREGPWKSLSSGKKVALAAGLSVGATVGYIVYRHIRSCSVAELPRTEQSRLSMPIDVYRSIARHQNTFLEQVHQKCGVQVNILPDGTEQNSVCFQLQGTAEQILLAKCALEKLANDCEVITDVIEVPHTAFGRIIGRGGETLKFITRKSGARVNCQREHGHSLEENGKVSIMGTRHEVQRAKDMITEKVLENETVRKRISQSSALRQKRKPPELELLHKAQDQDTELTQNISVEDSQMSEAMHLQTSCSNGFVSSGEQTAENSLKSDEDDIPSPASPLEVSKFEIPSPDLSFQPGEHLEVYVSASENPQHFWIQIVGVRSLQLDKLTTEMSRFYSGDTLQEHRVEAIVVGDIVAAPYRDHNTWNRARVLGILGSGLVDLYYVDFGDNGELPRDQLRSMRSDFLSLPFQAIECSLAGVCPIGEIWTEEALDDFDRMTYCAEWKPLLAKLCSYSHSEMSSWPSVKLYDNRQGKIVDLGEELISLGHALSYQDEGSGLRGDGDDPRSLQKMLDDMMGATSELSLSCISLSGSSLPWERRLLTWSSVSCSSSVEVNRADVDQNPSDMPKQSLLSLIHSISSPSLNEVVSNVTEPSSSVLSPLSHDRKVDVHQNSSKQVWLKKDWLLSTSSSSSLSCVKVVTSALGSVTLSDDVFFETSDSRSSEMASSDLMSMENSLSTCSENVCSSNSSDGVRGVWYYLSTSEDSSETSLNTTMPVNSTTSSFSHPTSTSSFLTESEDRTSVTSSSVICLSSDLSESIDDVEMTEAGAPEVNRPDHGHQKQCGDCIEVVDSSDCSSVGNDLIHISSDTLASDALSDSQPADKNVNNQQLSSEVDHAGNLRERNDNVCGGSAVKEMTETENKMGNWKAVLKEVASISGSVDDVLEEEFN